jgi:ferredoxin-fold anticodon binding domain-containing protein
LETQKYFWKNTEKWQKYTDKIIYLIWKQIEKLKENLWKKIFLKNIYSWKNFSWTLKNFSDHEIFFEDWKNFCLDEWEIL